MPPLKADDPFPWGGLQRDYPSRATGSRDSLKDARYLIWSGHRIDLGDLQLL